MINAKLTKLAKRLHFFTFDELLIMAEESEDRVEDFLKDFISAGKIKKIDEETYIYKQADEYQFKSKRFKEKVISKKFISFSLEEIQKLDEERNTLDAFINSPKAIKQMINKYIDLLKKVENMKGKKLYDYINEVWNVQHPSMETSQPAFYRAKRKLKKYGVAGLISPGRSFLSANHQLDETLYREFRDYVLENKGKSLKYNYTKFGAEHLKNNPEEIKRDFPSYNTFTTRIKNDILVFKDSELGNIYDQKKKIKIIQKKSGFNTFQTAAKDYLKDLIKSNEIKKTSLCHYKSYINLHLIPFFKNMKLTDINEKNLQKYEILLQEQSLTPQTIRRHINLIKKIQRIYMDNSYAGVEVKRIKMEFANGMNILDKKQLQKLLDTCKNEILEFYPLLVTSVNTGLTRGEVLSLTWDKVDWANKRIKINRSIYNGEIIVLKSKRAVRYVELPDKIIEILSKLKDSSKSIYIFPDDNGDFQNPEDMLHNKFLPLANKAGLENIKFIDLRDTYTALLIEQNLPLSYVKEQVGCSNLNTLVEKFGKFIPAIKKNFCLI
ncbi:MAG: tyrosine-type recombinase/integrase [bacterium]